MVLRSAAATAAASTGSLMRSRLPPFIVLCLAMGAALHAQPFVAAAAELRLHQDVVICIVLAVAVLFYCAICFVHFFIAHHERDPNVLLGLAAAAAPTSSTSRDPFRHFTLLCIAMGVLLHVEPLLHAATMLRIHPGMVACVVTALFNSAILSINFRAARRAAEREHKMLPCAAVSRRALPSSTVARLAFLVLNVTVSASWFVEPFAAAAELQLHRDVITMLVLLLAALFNLSVHFFRSFFLPCSRSAAAAVRQGQGVGAITAGFMGIGIAIAVCLIGDRWIHSLCASSSLNRE